LTESNIFITINRPEDAKMSENIEKLLTVPEISQLLRVPKSYIYWLTHRKSIPHLKINGHLRFRQSEVIEWLDSKEVSDVDLQEKL